MSDIADILDDRSNPRRIDTGFEPLLLIRDDESNDLEAYEALELLFTDNSALRTAGINQVLRTLREIGVLSETAARAKALVNYATQNDDVYWKNAISLYDALSSDPFWHIARLKQFVRIKAFGDCQTALKEIIDSLTPRTDLLEIAQDRAHGLTSLVDGDIQKSHTPIVHGWDFLTETTSLSMTDQAADASSGSPWTDIFAVASGSRPDDNAAMLSTIFSYEESISHFELLVARAVFLEVQNKYAASETATVIRLAWSIAPHVSEIYHELPQEVADDLINALDEWIGRMRVANLLWASPPRTGIEYFMTFSISRPWTVSTLLLCNGIPNGTDLEALPEKWKSSIADALKAACILELGAPDLEIRPGLPKSILDLSSAVGEQLAHAELSDFAQHAKSVAHDLNNVDTLSDVLQEHGTGDQVPVQLALSRISHRRITEPNEAIEAVRTVCSNDWLKRRLDSLEVELWPLLLETLVSALADTRIDSERSLAWSMCIEALKGREMLEATNDLVSATIICSVREGASNVTAVLTSREADDKVRTSAQDMLRTLNEMYLQVPENVRSRLRPHLQYLGWVH